MKSLKDYINTKVDIFTNICISNKLSDFEEYFEGNVPQYILDNPLEYTLSDIIEENLNSHDYVKLANKLYKEFSNDIIGFEEYTGIGDKKSFYIQVKDLQIKSDETFLSILSFYNYYIREIDKHNNYVIIAPIYSTNVTNYVWDKCYGKGYVFVLSNDLSKILKTGIRCKSNVDKFNITHNKISNRFYMFATKDSINKLNKETFKKFINKLLQYKKINNINKLSLLHIDLNKFSNGSSIIWYKDNLMIEPEAVFTEQPIPAECLSKIELPKYLFENINESKGEDIDEQWLNDEKPVMTYDGRQVIITKIDYEQVPNIIHGQVKMKEKLFDYEWNDDGMCTKALDQMGNPKKPDEADKLVKAV